MPESVSATGRTHEIERLSQISAEQGVTELVDLIVREGAIGLSQAAKFVGTYRGGATTSPSTLSRWIATGVRLPGGAVVRLEAVRVAGRLMTSKARVVAFIAKQNGAPVATAESASPTLAQRSRAAAQAANELDAALGPTNRD